MTQQILESPRAAEVVDRFQVGGRTYEHVHRDGQSTYVSREPHGVEARLTRGAYQAARHRLEALRSVRFVPGAAPHGPGYRGGYWLVRGGVLAPRGQERVVEGGVAVPGGYATVPQAAKDGARSTLRDTEIRFIVDDAGRWMGTLSLETHSAPALERAG